MTRAPLVRAERAGARRLRRGGARWARGGCLAAGIAGARRSFGPGLRGIDRALVASGLAVLAGVVLGGCGDDDGSAGRDAGSGAREDAGIAAAASPAPPVVACPEGWAPVDESGVDVACAPWRDGERGTCERGGVRWAGEPGCVRLGSECPADGWPAELPSGVPALFVRAGAAPGGDGSRDRPLARVEDALGSAPAGAVVAIAVGDYPEVLTVARSVALLGACATGVTIGGGPGPARRGRLTVLEGAEVSLRDVGLGGPGLALWVEPGASVDVRDVEVRDASFGGVTVLGVLTGARLRVRDVAPAADGRFGRGVHVQGGGRLAVARLAIERVHELGLSVAGAGTTVEVDDLVVHGVAPQRSDRGLGVGAVVSGGASLRIRRGVIEDARLAGINAGQPESRVDAEHLVVRRVAPGDLDAAGGTGLFAAEGGAIAARAALVEQVAHSGAVAYLAGASVTLTDAVVRDVAEGARGTGGLGLDATAGASVRAERLRVARVHASALSAQAGASMALRDVDVRGVEAQRADGLGGAGLVAETGATVRAERLSVAELRLVGVSAGGDAVVELHDLTVTGVRSQSVDGLYGHGLEARDAARLTAARVRIDDVRGVGVAAHGGATVQVEDLDLRGVAAMACAASTCAGRGAGIGLLARGASSPAARLELRRARVGDLALAGAQVVELAALALSDVRVARAPVGVSFVRAPADLAALGAGLSFADVERVVDATELPVPDPAVPPRVPVGR